MDEHARLTAAAVQWSPVADAAANREAIGRLARQAAADGARLIVLPEYASYFSPRLADAARDGAEPITGAFVQFLTALAAELDVVLVAGMLERLDEARPDEAALPGGEAAAEARPANTVVAVGAGGVLAHYRKLHLYDAFGQRESDAVSPGAHPEAPPVFELDGFAIGLQTCYDLRFPEVTRWLVDAGAEVVLVPAEWVAGPHKVHAWRTLLAARAIENTVYLIAADHTPPIGVGSSLVMDPLGLELSSLAEEEGLAMATLEADRLTEVRRANPALQLRRFGVHPLD